MYTTYSGIIIIGLTIVFSIMVISYNYNQFEFFSSNSKKTSLGVDTKHLEYAYKLCTQDNSSECRHYVILYDKLKKSFKKLKKDFCRLNPKKCQELLN